MSSSEHKRAETHEGEVEAHILLAGELDAACKGASGGTDTDGNQFSGVLHLWDTVLGLSRLDTRDGRALEEVKREEQVRAGGVDGIARWYSRNGEYWEETPATYDGVMGGLPELGPPDVAASRAFFHDVASQLQFTPDRCLELGAGIGRLSRDLLGDLFATVDLVERDPHIAARIPHEVPPARLGDVFVAGLQDFAPSRDYDAAWVQWCVGYLTDVHLVRLLRRVAARLKPRGVIFVKENSPDDEDDFFLYDNADHSIARSVKYFRAVFQRAGLKVLGQRKQTGFDPDILPVYMYALVPSDRPESRRLARAS